MSKGLAITTGVMAAGLIGLFFHQIRLGQRMDAAVAAWQQELSSRRSQEPDTETANREAALRLANAERNLELLEKRLSDATRRVATLEARAQQPQIVLNPRGRPLILTEPTEPMEPPPAESRGRSWGPEQVTGPPDTLQAGDRPTAWASRQPDAGAEWLKVEYEREVAISEVRVRETYNPGAVIRITAVLTGGEEALVWEGVEEPAPAPVDRSFLSPHPFKAKSVKIYLDTAKVSGWNEIDAVELVATDGTRQWASNASASSTYASQ